MDLYRVTLGDRSTFLMRADMTDAAATVSVNFRSGGDQSTWHDTPFRTADVGYDAAWAPQFVSDYFRPGNGDTRVDSVEVAELG
jgi:hypothetical protein